MIYLLDTNVCVLYLRGRDPGLRQRLSARSPTDVCLCSVVRAELYRGVLRSAHVARNQADVDAFVAPYVSLPFDDAAANVHARIRHELETSGCPIGPYDSQIAAIALANDLTLVTNNLDEFRRVPGLKLEDWRT